MTFEDWAKRTYGEERYKEMPFIVDLKVAFTAGQKLALKRSADIAYLKGLNQDCNNKEEYMYGKVVAHNISAAIEKLVKEI